ncbi:MAG: hypothetical protein V7641_2404 [Blastocatellia bacterium]
MKLPEEKERSPEYGGYSSEALARRQALLQEAERIQKRWEAGPRKTTRLRVGIALAWLVLILLVAAFFARRISVPSSIPPPTGYSTGTNSPPAISPQVNTENGALKELMNGFVPLPAGEFMMGSENGSAAEKPVHRVRLSRPFEMGKYEVTQAQWEAVMGNNPSYFKGSNRPVEQVSWHDVQEFIEKLNALNDGYVYRLPTEAEWEYACRAGSNGDYSGKLDAMAWCDNNSDQMSHPVGAKQPNAWGLYDMHGNVFEWCQDWYDNNYAESPSLDPQGPASGSFRVKRGGSWAFPAAFSRSAARDLYSPGYRFNFLGFRLVRTPR